MIHVEAYRPKRAGPAWRGVRIELPAGTRSHLSWSLSFACMRAWVAYVALGCGLPSKAPHTRVAASTAMGRCVGLVRVYRGTEPTEDDLARMRLAMDLALGLEGPVCYTEG
jgi:hypothetical protein